MKREFFSLAKTWHIHIHIAGVARSQLFLEQQSNGLYRLITINCVTKLVKAIKEEVKWFPESGEDRILGMVKTRPDWCLSRQR